MTNSHISMPTPHGIFVTTYSQAGLCRLEFPGKTQPPKTQPNLTGLAKRWHRTTVQTLETILLGQARSYGELAKRVGKLGASRAVGSACGANPIPVIVPCHRVLATHGRIGGFSGCPGWKQRLLKIENTLFIE